MPKTSKKPKHPREMNSDEALKHLFHPKVVRHVKKLVAKANSEPAKKKV